MWIDETVHLGRANPVRLILTVDGKPYEALPGVERMRLIVGPVTVDSAVTPGVLDWTRGGGRLDMHLGLADLAPGRHDCRLEVWLPGNQAPTIWTEPGAKTALRLRVIGYE